MNGKFFNTKVTAITWSVMAVNAVGVFFMNWGRSWS